MISFDCIFDHRDLHYTVGRQALRVSLRARLRLDVPLKELVFRYKGVTAREGRPCPARDSVDCQMSTKQKYASGALDISVLFFIFLTTLGS